MTVKAPRVCLVDDDRIFQFTLEKMLHHIRPDVSVVGFSDGEGAFTFLKEHQEEAQLLPDVLLLDLNMPYMDGWQFLDAFQEFSSRMAKKISIYLVSSSIDPRDVNRARQYEVVRQYVPKPITTDQLRTLLISTQPV